MKCREAERGLEEREPWRSGAEGRAASQTTAAAGFSSSLLVSGSVAISPGRRGVVDPCKCETKNFLPERGATLQEALPGRDVGTCGQQR
ncbi:uncharacterized protein LOC144284990 isoform X2 [Canis aureus]